MKPNLSQFVGISIPKIEEEIDEVKHEKIFNVMQNINRELRKGGYKISLVNFVEYESEEMLSVAYIDKDNSFIFTVEEALHFKDVQQVSDEM